MASKQSWYTETMNWVTLNIDELMYRFHLVVTFFWDIVSFKWARESSVARTVEEENRLGIDPDAGFFDRWFGSALYRADYSRPGNERDSLANTLNDDTSIGEVLLGILFGYGDRESIFSILFGSFVGWFLILGIVAFLLSRYFKGTVSYLEEKKKLNYAINHSQDVPVETSEKSRRWQDIVAKTETGNTDLMKIAVLDADILMDEVLREQGYAGDSVSDKLQAAADDGVGSIDAAWAAHKIRNLVAHDSSYTITERDASQAIKNFERFFGELYHL